MTRSIPMIQVQKELMHLPEEFQKKPRVSAISVTRRGKPVLAVLPWKLYESLLETLDLLRTAKRSSELKAGPQDLRAGKLIPWDKIKREMKL